ncbi:hypothetical protein SAMN03080617_04197 [Algoriphagus alkaliphilus]|uniref:Uncharacterized protein n=1 Tax=Algoriphagus alkaliphilus TaxID=279824 RepID=A0A1G5ZNU1_9BACT|nr:hypothetical protein SAMN03080617_04197 [Algoriphagus alkaliphilus]
MVAPKKVWTYNKYKTILSTLSKVVFERLDTKYLPLSKLRDLETIRQITLGFEVIFQKKIKSTAMFTARLEFFHKKVMILTF